MTDSSVNEAQAQFWTAAGSTWTEQRDNFDQQANDHGLAAVDALAPTKGEFIIDIGCGAGTSSVQLAERVGDSGRVSALDISPTMIEGAEAFAAGHGIDNITFAVADAMFDDMGPDADCVYSRFGVMFFADATAGLANMRRALRDGGRLSFVCWQSPKENPWASVPLSIASNHVEMPFGTDPTAPGPFSLGDPDRLNAVLDDAEWSDVVLTSRQADLNLGDDLDEAIAFMTNLMPPLQALAKTHAEKFATFRSELSEALSTWTTSEGVICPSATWIVTANK